MLNFVRIPIPLPETLPVRLRVTLSPGRRVGKRGPGDRVTR